MNQEDLEAIIELSKQINMIAEKKVKNAPFDRTVRGRVIDILANNTYEVIIDGIKYNAKSKQTYELNDFVYILIPQNNYNELIIIY